MTRKTTEQYIQEAKSIHGEKFDYSKTTYNGWRNLLTVICPIHGEFQTYPNNHLRSKFGSCPDCNPKKQITTEEFIEKAKAVFPDYDYTNTVYINSYTSIKAMCKAHGEFSSYPINFLKGEGCPVCIPRREITFDKKKAKNKFIEKANLVHNNKYDYSLVDYLDNKIKVKIICPIHGEFEQRPDLHLCGNGCPICGKIKAANTQRSSREEFIEKAKLMHGDKYDYSLVDYKGNNSNIKIICPIHGVFEQKPDKHLIGHGCPKCVGRERTTKEAIEDIENKYPGKYDLSKFEYINATADSWICCKKHNY